MRTVEMIKFRCLCCRSVKNSWNIGTVMIVNKGDCPSHLAVS